MKVFPHLPVRRDAFILRVATRYLTANISGVELQETQRMTIVLLFVLTGIRVEAWDYMKWKHITLLKDENGITVAAKLVVYPNEAELYVPFMTPEAYNEVRVDGLSCIIWRRNNRR